MNSLFLFAFVCVLQCTFGTRPKSLFLNQYAVYVPEGSDKADEIARKHGFINMGQIGDLSGYYLLESPRIRKRSLEPAHGHTSLLNKEPGVMWVEQQVEKKRNKRDFQQLYSPYTSFNVKQYPFTDPLFREQWYLNGGSNDGSDMNVLSAWQTGYTGKGVSISILDDGIQTNHPDLALNYDPLASQDINDHDDDPMPRDNGDNKHGTRCAGEVSAIAFNEWCGVGIAYNSSIGGVRMLDGTVNDAVEAQALSLNPNHIDIYSASWGPEDDGKTVDGPGPLARRAFINGVMRGRNGKGSIFVWASGNGGKYTDSCNCDGYTNSIFTLSISSATQAGYKPWYLEECASTLATTFSSGRPGLDKSVVTCDMDGHMRPDRLCTAEHTGTSASAPLAAGICALALEANPHLTWRDMQHLVVLTSRSDPLLKERGWVTNGVGRNVSHKFGYGMMDAATMANIARTWTTVPPQHICQTDIDRREHPIDNRFGGSIRVMMHSRACAGTLHSVRYLEHVQCRVSLRFLPRGNLRILLTSPMGTTSTLLFERPRDVLSANFNEWPFLSVHYWGEKAEGTWVLEIINAGSRLATQPGFLKSWQLVFYGTAVGPIRAGHSRDFNTFAPSSPPIPTFQTLPQAPHAVRSSLPFRQPYETPVPSFINPPVFGHDGFPDFFTLSGSEQVDTYMTQNGTARPSENGSIPCHPECEGGCLGQGPYQCHSCRHYNHNGACVATCPSRYYGTDSGACEPCHASCSSCHGPDQNACLSCPAELLLVADMGFCMPSCPSGYYRDDDVCNPCGPYCSSCDKSPTNCTGCEHNLVLYNGQCLARCPLNTFETVDYDCVKCHESCETCVGESETECLSCPSGTYLSNGTCVAECHRGFFSNKEIRECYPCPQRCAHCDSSLNCLKCSEGNDKNRQGQCLPRAKVFCQPGEYSTRFRCKHCHHNCNTCWGPRPNQCLSCDQNLVLSLGVCAASCPASMFLSSVDRKCRVCPFGCKECLGLHRCVSCDQGLVLQEGRCQTACNDGYYSDVGVCSSCDPSCATCLGPGPDQCVTCYKGSLITAGSCHSHCPQGYFRNQQGCEQCHESCKTCTGLGLHDCTTCSDNLMLQDGICIECSQGHYYNTSDSKCAPCHRSCHRCHGSGSNACSECLPPLKFDPLQHRCAHCCDEGEDTGACCRCDTRTNLCVGSLRSRNAVYPEAEMALSSKAALHSEDFSLNASGTVILLCVGCVAIFFVVFLILQSRTTQNQSWQCDYTRVQPESPEEMALMAEEAEKMSLIGDEMSPAEEDDYDSEEIMTSLRT